MSGVGAAETRYLGFDFGDRSIGVAVGNASTRTATPVAALLARDGKPDWPSLDALVQEWQPAGLVIGLPLHMDGSESPMSEAARRFSRRLSARYHLPAFMADERLSSQAADAELDAQGLPRSKARNDAAAACLILETWLREQRD